MSHNYCLLLTVKQDFRKFLEERVLFHQQRSFKGHEPSAENKLTWRGENLKFTRQTKTISYISDLFCSITKSLCALTIKELSEEMSENLKQLGIRHNDTWARCDSLRIAEGILRSHNSCRNHGRNMECSPWRISSPLWISAPLFFPLGCSGSIFLVCFLTFSSFCKI